MCRPSVLRRKKNRADDAFEQGSHAETIDVARKREGLHHDNGDVYDKMKNVIHPFTYLPVVDLPMAR